MGSSDVFYPHSSFARPTVYVLNVTLIIGAVIFVLVATLVTICLIRFRHRPGQGEPPQMRGHALLEVVWTVVPFLIVVYIFVISVRAMNASDPASDPSQTPDVVVTGRQFWWDVRYPKTGAVTANEIHIPVGQKLLFELRAGDVIHDFWVPQLSRKMDLMPDRERRIWVQADKAGTYAGTCSEYCGVQHAWMRILVIAEPEADFEAWQHRLLQPAAAPSSPEAIRGAKLAQQYTCVTCHVITTPNPAAVTGPDLRHMAERRTLAAGVLANTPENLERWLKDPQAVKPGNLMPNFRFTDQQVSDLASFLQTLK